MLFNIIKKKKNGLNRLCNNVNPHNNQNKLALILEKASALLFFFVFFLLL